LKGRLKYALKIGLFLGVLGGAVFFIWGMIEEEFIILSVVQSTLTAMLIFGVMGFILGYSIYYLEH